MKDLTRVGRNGDGRVIIYNDDETTGDQDQTLTITDTLIVKKALYFRSFNTDGRLTVNVANLIIDHSAEIGISEAPDSGKVTLHVTENTTFKGGNTRFYLFANATQDTQVNLGHIIFEKSLSGGSPGIDIQAQTLRVKSLETPAEGSVGTIRVGIEGGAGTLLIDGGEDQGTTSFSSVIINQGSRSLTVEKSGNTIQILNPQRGNRYTGGTVIRGGVLAVNNEEMGSSGLGSGAVTVKAQGTLAGNGAIVLGAGNSTTVEAGGIIAPSAYGTAGFSVLRFNNYANKDKEESLLLKMEDGSGFTFNVDQEGHSDQILFGYFQKGSVIFNGSIAVNVKGDLAEGVIYNLFTFKARGGTETGLLESSGLFEGLVAGKGFEKFIPTFHYDEPEVGGIGIISMTVNAR